VIPKLIGALQNIIQNDLPGERAHLALIPERIQASTVFQKGMSYKNSAVSVLLFEENGIIQSVLIQRPKYDGAHSDQMAFPGGKVEPEDASFKVTALREMYEEIGFEDAHIAHLGNLTRVYIPVSQFMVYPHVFFTTKKVSFSANKREVASIVCFPLLDILNPDIFIKTTIPLQNGLTLKNMAAISIQNKIVWGATLLILNELRLCLKKLNL